MLPYTVSENRIWDGYPTRLRIDHSKLAHENYLSMELPLTFEDSTNYKTYPNEHPSLNNKDANCLTLLTKL